MYYRCAMDEEFHPFTVLDTIRNKFTFYCDNPTYFQPDGLIVFVGPQGSGKTLSAVNYVCNLMKYFPSCKLVTNLYIKDYPIVDFTQFLFDNYNSLTIANFDKLSDEMKSKLVNDYHTLNRVFAFRNGDDLTLYDNMFEGVIFLIDEIQLYFNSLQSKNINPQVMTELSQQRKQRKHIVATSQVFGRMSKPLREQFSTVVTCRKYFNCLQCNRVIERDDIDDNSINDMHLQGRVSQKVWFFHTQKMYDRYDTYYKINNTKFAHGENMNQLIGGEVYGLNNTR